MPPRRRKRLEPEAFAFSAESLAAGALSELPSRRARDVLHALENGGPRVTVQLNAERAGVLAGSDEAIALLKLGVPDWSALTVHALFDGDTIEAWEPVLTVEGRYSDFVHLEPLCLGVLSRRTRVATNAKAISDAARIKPVFFFPSRHDHGVALEGDVAAASVGRVFSATADVRPARGQPPVAFVPRSLVAAFAGDAVEAAKHFAKIVDAALELVVPVDHENDSVATAVAVSRAMEGRLWGVLVATPETLVDKSIIPQMGSFVPNGVNPQLVWAVRNALDAEGFGEVRIVVSGGFTADRIRQFEDDGVAVDAYGIGSALYAGRHGFSADVVAIDGTPRERPGGGDRDVSRLERVR